MGNDKLACSGELIGCTDFNNAWHEIEKSRNNQNGPGMLAELLKHQQAHPIRNGALQVHQIFAQRALDDWYEQHPDIHNPRKSDEQ